MCYLHYTLMEELAPDYVNWLNRRSGLCPYTFTQFILFLFLIVFNTKPIIAILLVQGTAQWLRSKDAVAKPRTPGQYPVGRRLMHLVLCFPPLYIHTDT